MAPGPTALGRARWRITIWVALLAAFVAVEARGASEGLESTALPGLRAEVATLILQGVSGGSIEMQMAAAVDPGAGPSAASRLTVVIEVAGQSLLEAAEHGAAAKRLVLELYGYAFDREDEVTAFFARRIEVDSGRWKERSGPSGLRLVEEVEIPSGEAWVRALVLAPGSGRFAMAVSEAGSESGEPGWTAVRPRFEASCADWLVVQSPMPNASERSSALPVLRPGESVEALLNLERDLPSEASYSATFESDQGEVFRVGVENDAVRAPRGGHELGLGFLVPDLPTGVYSVAISVEDGAESQPTRVWVVDEPGACAWPDVVEETVRTKIGIVPTDVGSARSGSVRKRATVEYLELLAELGRGQDLESAVESLVDWESATVGDQIEKNLELMTEAQLRVVNRLAALDPACLQPVFRLHQSAYEAHFEARKFGLSGHSRRLAAALVEAWLIRLPQGAEPGWGADALVSLAATSDRHLMLAPSQGFLERAVAIAPQHREGRLLLAMLHEKLGDYEAAEQQLEELVATAPEDSEAWLRLATIRQRLGRSEGSPDALRRVIEQRPATWLLSLAYQTLVKELYIGEQFADGLRLLEEAETSLPGDRHLALAKAYGLDRLGRGSEAARILEQDSRPADRGKSYRLRYAEASRDLARRVAVRLERNTLVQQARLGEAVAGSKGEAG